MHDVGCMPRTLANSRSPAVRGQMAWNWRTSHITIVIVIKVEGKGEGVRNGVGGERQEIVTPLHLYHRRGRG